MSAANLSCYNDIIPHLQQENPQGVFQIIKKGLYTLRNANYGNDENVRFYNLMIALEYLTCPNKKHTKFKHVIDELQKKNLLAEKHANETFLKKVEDRAENKQNSNIEYILWDIRNARNNIGHNAALINDFYTSDELKIVYKLISEIIWHLLNTHIEEAKKQIKK